MCTTFEAGEIQSGVPGGIVALITSAPFPRREQNACNPCCEGASSRFWNENKLSEALKHGGSEGEKVGLSGSFRGQEKPDPRYLALLESASEFSLRRGRHED
ncbi:MAG: hypothetical protein DBX00_08070 [Verrucomicrobia bacterium]|nr:MAG: hypothetical protein DBX00_08070 [Verrucomicrobiota bacterium]